MKLWIHKPTQAMVEKLAKISPEEKQKPVLTATRDEKGNINVAHSTRQMENHQVHRMDQNHRHRSRRVEATHTKRSEQK